LPNDPYYRTPQWRTLRAAALERDQYRCVVPGCGDAAVIVDHIVRRKAGGADTLGNLRSLCKRHDGQVKERANGKRGNAGRLVELGCDASGRPLDPGHHWHRPAGAGRAAGRTAT